MGLETGDRVALLASTTSDFLVLFFACQYAGFIPVPLPVPTAFGRREAYIQQISAQIKLSGSRILIGPEELMQSVKEETDMSGLLLCGTRDDIIALPCAGAALRPGGANDLCYIQYSSGSTRFPIGVAVTNRSLMANCVGMNRDGVKIAVGDRCASWLPFYHDLGLVGFMLGVVTSQTSVDYLPTEDFARRPLTWLKMISQNQSTVSFAPSFGYELCARRAETIDSRTLDIDLSRWRVAGIGGEMIKPRVMLQFAQTFEPFGFSENAFCASYGLAESVVGVSFSIPGTGMQQDYISKKALAEEHRARVIPDDGSAVGRSFVKCGKVLPNHKVEIRDENGNALNDREIGRVFVWGPSVMQGYYDDAVATERAIIDGWLDTGDLGYFSKDELVIVGRAKDMMIVNGRNFWPQDIEWTVEHMDGVRSGDSAAITLTDDDGAEHPTILVQCRIGTADQRRSFSESIRSEVHDTVGLLCEVIMVPPRSLPKTSSGKLARSKAKANYEAGDITQLDLSG